MPSHILNHFFFCYLQVEEGSPAQAAGLKEGDRIIEVNGASINGEVHKQVVSRIKQNPNETKLLVVDKESYEYFQANSITITSTLPEVKIKVTKLGYQHAYWYSRLHYEYDTYC